MDFVLFLLGVPLIIGIVIAVIERRKKTIFFKHDLNLRGPTTEASREAERAAQAIREAHQRSMMKHH